MQQTNITGHVECCEGTQTSTSTNSIFLVSTIRITMKVSTFEAISDKFHIFSVCRSGSYMDH